VNDSCRPSSPRAKVSETDWSAPHHLGKVRGLRIADIQVVNQQLLACALEERCLSSARVFR